MMPLWMPLLFLLAVICKASAALAASPRLAPADTSVMRSVGKAALERVFYGRKIGSKAGTLRSAFSPSKEYVMVFDCDTTRRGYAGDSAVMHVIDAADTLQPRQLWERRFNPHEVEVMLTDRYACLAVNVTRGKDSKEYFMTQFLRLSDGEVATSLPMFAAYINDSLDVAVGYESKYSSTLVAYRISSGELLWTEEMTGMPVCPWENVVPYDGGGKLAVLLDRLYSVDISTGKLQNSPMMRSPYALDAAVALGGVFGAMLAGLLGGMPRLACLPYHANTRVGSNLCYDGERFYVCDGAYAYAYTKEMKRLWKTKLDFDGSHLSLSADDSRLCLFSFGDGDRNGRKVKDGKSFYMEFSKESGERLCGERLSEGRAYAVDTLRSGVKPVHFLYRGSLATIADGKAVVTNLPEGVFGRADHFVAGRVFQAQKGSMSLKEIHYDGRLLVATDRQRLFEFTPDEPFGKVYDADDMYLQRFMLDDLYCLRSVGNRKYFCLADKDMQLKLQFDDDVIRVLPLNSGIIVVKRNANILVTADELEGQGGIM